MNNIGHFRSFLTCTFLLGALIGSAAAALVTEIPDAGQTLLGAQDTTVVASVTGLRGQLSAEPSAGPDLVDMYKVSIRQGATFYANTGLGIDPALIADPVLFVFDAFGVGVLMDDESGGFGQALLSFTALTGGDYYLAILFAGLEPLDVLGNPMFDVFGSGGMLSSLALGSWFGTPFALDPSVEGRYEVAIQVVPVPGTLLLAVLGLAALRATHKSRSRQA